MPLDSILAVVKADCMAITGVNDAMLGQPYSTPFSEAPYVWIVGRLAHTEWLTYGGNLQMTYLVTMHLVAGAMEMRYEDALAALTPFTTRFIKKFFTDDTLGGTCQDSQLNDAGDNLDSYFLGEVPPEFIFVLTVLENANVSEM